MTTPTDTSAPTPRPSAEGAAREPWGVCAGCSVNERAEKLNEEGLCFWCTPEGKEKMKEIDGRARSGGEG